MRRLLVAALPLLFAPFLHSQDCAPRPVLAPTPDPPVRKVVFRNAGQLTAEERRDIAKVVREGESAAISAADEAADRTRAAYQNRGYFLAKVTALAVPVVGSVSPEDDVVVHVVRQGPQYFLGDMKFSHVTQFSEPQLRDLFAIQRGEIFSREKIVEGLEQLRHFYGAQGYMNEVSVPDTTIDDEHAVVNLNIDVDEGRQFRVRSVEVLGVDEQEKARLLRELGLEVGALYTPHVWELFLRNLPTAPDDPDTVTKRLDERDGWADIVIDLRQRRPCRIDLSVPTIIP